VLVGGSFGMNSPRMRKNTAYGPRSVKYVLTWLDPGYADLSEDGRREGFDPTAQNSSATSDTLAQQGLWIPARCNPAEPLLS
jgi:hypothetical protein